MRRKNFLLLLTLIFGLNIVNAQSDYEAGGEFSAGLRVGGESGVSVKWHFENNKTALELLATSNFFNQENNGFTTNFLIEKLAALSSNHKLSAIIGAGFGARWDKSQYGPAGIIGFDWRMFRKLNFQVDWQPTWYLFGKGGWSNANAAFTMRYNIFN
ncbi:MAG TPA: hypothetical protein PK147_10375 [Saprospiraceae bacterium]|nr:hypothetical protein [Saprospiraceae bacterium]MCB9328618.1 hypothetical protein [Lewinellaceae bacterium]HPK10739.1 hypothetical protein [Saprospiraceae bacterium]HPQ22248.1 hypothetical protein [Saprospiraceae bacterium]HRX29262.1 hypothetical protein [Saprospiraceae bacterium]